MSSASTSFWNDVVSEALEVAQVSATAEQIAEVTKWVESAHDGYGDAFGHDVVVKNFNADQRNEVDRLQRAVESEREKIPCPHCEGKRAPTLNGQWEPARYQCDYCDRTGKVRP